MPKDTKNLKRCPLDAVDFRKFTNPIFRSIPSAIKSPTYDISTDLCEVLLPHVGSSNIYIRDRALFIEKIKTLFLQTSFVLVSFDFVVLLFTRTLVKETINRLKKNSSEDVTSLFHSDLF